MFEIPKAALLQLTDWQLRELVARLCEAELRLKGFSASAVRWGGAQTTPDGGLDVDCRVEAESFERGFVPRARTGFQVKKSTMRPGAIKSEMSPKGALRPVFPVLASENGCYVIVSLADNVPPEGDMLQTRLTAMESQIEQITNQGSLEFQFYGRGDLANWLRQHPSVQLWVRRLLDLPLRGWNPYGRWAKTPRNVSDDLICREGVVIRTPGTQGEGLEIAPGIEEIRKLVRSQQRAVRIVGLSGVGKTRIVQALFEEEVGTDALSRSLAIYADLSDELVPSPLEVIETLAAEQRDAIVVLDNCPSATHEDLARRVADEPKIRLISIEYDIRDDKPEATYVVHIDARGPEIAETLIRRRYRNLGQANARRVAEFSGGNARLAILLADAVKDEGSLSGFSNQQLFERLFYQRNAPDGDLLAAAEVLALTYSFSIRPGEDGIDELGVLAQISGQSRGQLYRAAQILALRQLAQKRGRWRAILPHAVANRVAARALTHIDPQEILDAIQGLPSPRLLMSFGRRLGYLHDHETAREIVESWLSPNGLLHDFGKLDHNGIRLLTNIAPVAPGRVLQVMEDQARGKSPSEFFHYISLRAVEVVGMLVAIAFDPDLFERCVDLLANISLGDYRESDRRRDRFVGLFTLYLSGTEAPPEMRERVTRRYLESSDTHKQQLGLEMLKAALQSRGWMSVGTNEFGARARTFGYCPENLAELECWFVRFLALLDETDLRAGSELSEKLRRVLADELPGLWEYEGLRAELAALIKRLHNRRAWIEGRRAVRNTMTRYRDPAEASGETSPAMRALKDLDTALAPQELVDQVKAYVFSPGASIFSRDDQDLREISGRERRSFNRGVRKAHSLGKAVADDPSVIDTFSEELFASPQTYAYEFGKGLAEQTEDPNGLLNHLVSLMELAGERARQCQVLIGVLQVAHERNPRDAESFLDKAVVKTALRRFIVDLHRALPFSDSSVARLLRVLSHTDTPARQFAILGWSTENERLSEADMERLMLKVLERADGPEVVLEGMYRRLHFADEGNANFGIRSKRLSLMASSRVLRRGSGAISDDVMARYLAKVLKKSIDEPELAVQAGELLDALLAGLNQSRGHLGHLTEVVAAIADKATDQFLDGIFLDPGLRDNEREQVFIERRGSNPLSRVDASQLLDWCRQGNFEQRLVMVAGAIYPFEKGSREGEIQLTEQALCLIEAASDPSEIVGAYAPDFNPPYWTGSFSATLQKKRQALSILLENENADIRGAAEELIERIRLVEDREREREREADRWRGQTFE